jgi:NAD(P)-dependent dehydrogenase (short-subunit alcohol dehydrogenase family)
MKSPENNPPRWIMVTGASTGIGRVTTEYLVNKGFCVYACARSENDLASLARIRHVVPIRLDVTKKEEIAAAVKFIEKNKTSLHGLVNNAGIVRGGPLVVLPDGLLEHLFDTNFFGMHHVTKAFFPMINRNHGRIIIIGSVTGFIGYPFAGPYCASKHAIEAYADCLRRELFFTGTKVSLVQPGFIKTALWAKSASRSARIIELLGDPLWKPHKNESIRFFRQFLKDADDLGINPEKVAHIVFRSLTDRHPKNRYLATELNLKYRLIQTLSNSLIDLYFKYLYRSCR